jgi:serine/threonine protein kinase
VLPPGSLDRFELQRQVGSGGTATVYRALDRQTGALVALKILHGRSSEQTGRFGQEAEVLAELSHPAIVRYVAHGSTPLGEHYLAMEWLEGENLSDRLAGGPLTIGESVDLGRRVADALASAHRRGIVHRDIKPSNLFLPNNRLEEAKLLDFGLARRLFDPRRITEAGGIMGTPMYMAPEQARGEKEIDARADLFSLGCVMVECLTGQPPFTGPTAMAVLAKICLDESLAIRELCPGLPADLEATLTNMLAKERDARPRDAATVETELTAIGERLDPTSRDSSGRSTTAVMRPARDTLTTGEQRVICVVLVTRPRPRQELALPDASSPSSPSSLPGGDAGTRAAEAEAKRAAEKTVVLPANRSFDEADFEGLRATLVPYGARVDRLLDGSMVVTLAGRGAPTDQAAHAARCALRLRATLPEVAMTVSTGRAVIFGQLPVGDVIDRGAELLRGEPGGKIRLDTVTADLLGTRFELEGAGDRRYLIGEHGRDDVPRTLLGKATVCVGRDRELTLLEGTFDECVDEPVARAVLVTAPAGGGKSRLRHEITERLRRGHPSLQVLVGRGDAIAVGSPFGLLAPALRAAASITAADSGELRRQKVRALVTRRLRSHPNPAIWEFLGELVGVPFDEDTSPALHAARRDPRLMGDRLRSAWIDWLAAECAQNPVLLVLEDIQWGDRSSLQLVDAALRALREQPLMVLAFARPEVDEQFPNLWGERDLQRVTLRALTRKACQNLAQQVLGEGLAPAIQDWLVERADGNPFYLEELIREVASGARSALPETVVGMVQARLDTLGSDAKRVLRAASIFGISFSRDDISALISDRNLPALDAALEALVAREVILPEGTDRYVFRHSLLREAAYAMLTEGDRGLGHLLAGEWLEKSEVRDPLILVEHFERGGDRQRAARWCRQAADEALARSDLPGATARARRGVALGATGALRAGLRLCEARAHFWRGEYAMGEETAWDGVACAAEGDAIWFDCVGELAASLGQQGRYDEVTTWAATAEQAAPRSGATFASVACLLRAAGYLLRAGDDVTTEAILAHVDATVGDVARLEPGLRARYQAVQAMRRLRHGDHAGAIDLLQAGLASASRTGDTGTMCDLRVSLASVWADLGQLDTAEALLRQTLEQSQTIELHYITTAALINLAPVLTHSGRLGEARRLAMQALNFARKQGDQRGEGAAQLYLSTISYVAGEHPGSEQRARRAAEIGSPSLRASALAAVARALLAQARRPEALEQARAAAAELAARAASGRAERYESLVHLVLAEALAAAGDTAAARVQARAALLANPDWRRSFLTKLPDNARILALAREWGVSEDSRPVRVDAVAGPA